MVVVNISYAIGGHTLAAKRYEIIKFSNVRFPACLYLIFMYCLYLSGSF